MHDVPLLLNVPLAFQSDATDLLPIEPLGELVHFPVIGGSFAGQGFSIRRHCVCGVDDDLAVLLHLHVEDVGADPLNGNHVVSWRPGHRIVPAIELGVKTRSAARAIHQVILRCVLDSVGAVSGDGQHQAQWKVAVAEVRLAG